MMGEELINTEELINIINQELDKNENKGISYYDTMLTIFQNIKNEDIDKIIVSKIRKEEKIKLFKANIKAYNETVKTELDRVIKHYMSNSSVSYGEAYILADKHFQQEINHIQIFTLGLIMSVLILQEKKN